MTTHIIPKFDLLFVGAPTSGKSTIIQSILERSDAIHINFDDEIARHCKEEAVSGSLTDEFINVAANTFLSSQNQTHPRKIMELPHHDYLSLIKNGYLRLSDYDCIVAITAPLKELQRRNINRGYEIPFEYIVRCWGATISLIEYIKLLDIHPFLLLDSDFLLPHQMAELVIQFQRRNVSTSLSLLEINPVPEKPYLGGHYRSQNEWDQTLVDYLVSRYKVKTALDVGCGLGLTLDYFDHCGVKCWGLEGNSRVLDGHCHSKERLFIFDLNKQWVEWPAKVDLVWCVEVLEHISEKYEENIIRTISNNVGTVAFISAAPPGQSGYFHINCKPREYWIERFSKQGLSYVEETPKILESLDNSGLFNKNFIKENGLIFEVI